jgi:gas vesicle protein
MNERIYYSQEAERRAARDRFTMAVIVTGFGIGVGAIIALLLAPRPGDHTRRQIGETISQAATQGAEVAGQVARTVIEGAGKVSEGVSGFVQETAKR